MVGLRSGRGCGEQGSGQAWEMGKRVDYVQCSVVRKVAFVDKLTY